MSLAQTQVIPRPERRRSERVPLALPLIVRGVSLDTKPFQEDAFTVSVSAHGALVALSTTVTLGQALFLRNPQTQEEVGAWVTRFGPPRGGMAHVGVELVQPDVHFWSARPRVSIPEEIEQRPEQQIHVLPDPDESGQLEPSLPGSGVEKPRLTTMSPRSSVPAAPTSSEGLLQALEQTLQQAAEQAVAATANTRLSSAVNQATDAIENFGQKRIRQLEDRLVQYREEFVVAAREDFLSRLKTDIEQTQEHLRNRAAEVLHEGSTKAHDEFAGKMQETASQTASQFSEHATAVTTETAARIVEHAQTATNDVRARIDAASEALAEAQEKIKAETDHAILEARQQMDLLTSQCKEVYAACETRLQTFQEELTHTSGQEVELFRARLRSVLTNLLSSLG